MADLTPPVALAAFAAASIAKASPMRIGWKATHIAIAGFVIPYMAVYDPALMLQPTARQRSGGLAAVLYVVFKTVLAIGLWGARLDRLSARTDQLARAHRRFRRGRAPGRGRAVDG